MEFDQLTVLSCKWLWKHRHVSEQSEHLFVHFWFYHQHLTLLLFKPLCVITLLCLTTPCSIFRHAKKGKNNSCYSCKMQMLLPSIGMLLICVQDDPAKWLTATHRCCWFVWTFTTHFKDQENDQTVPYSTPTVCGSYFFQSLRFQSATDEPDSLLRPQTDSALRVQAELWSLRGIFRTAASSAGAYVCQSACVHERPAFNQLPNIRTLPFSLFFLDENVMSI